MASRVSVVAVVLGCITLAVFVPDAASATSHAVAPVVRVDQVGYPSTGSKVAYLMSGSRLDGAPFSVRDAAGTAVYAGVVGSSSGSWNKKYEFVYPLTFSSVTSAGTYRIVVSGPVTVDSPSFAIGTAATLWHQALSNSLSLLPERTGRP